MKAKLTYNLPDDEHEFKRASLSTDIVIVLWDFLFNGHREYKHSDDCPEEFYNGFRKAQDDLYKKLDERSINIDKLIE